MYTIGLTIFLAFLAFSAYMSGGLSAFVDLPSIILILSFSVPMLLASGLAQDFTRGFRIMGQKINTCSLLELRKTQTALKLMIKLILFSGLIGTLTGIICIAINMHDLSTFMPNLAVSLLTLLYSLLLVFLLLPVKARVNTIILTMNKEASYEDTND
ncbi:MAG TPA: MotA/TolQ/ExbB proton channel family protein [Negativicutes bacterium]|nr:MotA/TolQ/ExbB proton channel family protein [Negativicutes bacterium]